MTLSGQRVLVVGLGKSGAAAARFLLSQGAFVSVTDSRPRSKLHAVIKALPRRIRIETGGHRFLKQRFDLIVISPGVPFDLPELKAARKKMIPVWPELELAWRFVHPYKTVAVTGTNGKTTTTALLGHILKTAKKPVVVGGNIGTPLVALIDRIKTNTFLVLETSSYQLEAVQSFNPDVGVVMNVTPDHLARHKTMANYARVKGRLFMNATANNVAVLNRRDKWCQFIGRKIKARKAWFPSASIMSLARSVRLPGSHNLENAMAAVLAAKAIGIGERDIRRALKTFPGVPHRIEFVRELGGVRYINDSKATNVDSTAVALKAAVRPTILILGGEHKGSPYTPLIPLIKRKVKEILTIGEAASIIQKELHGVVTITNCGNMKHALAWAAAHAVKGDDVLLSPACASFDQYKNFEERGLDFCHRVRSLKCPG